MHKYILQNLTQCEKNNLYYIHRYTVKICAVNKTPNKKYKTHSAILE